MSGVDKTGGPAFSGNQASVMIPENLIEQARLIQTPMSGMSMRDWFAGLALQGIIADGSRPLEPYYMGVKEMTVGEYAYAVADLMLKARE